MSAISRGRMKETKQVKGRECNIPHLPGIYRWKDNETGEVIYVGQTNDLRRRLQEHSRSGDYNSDKYSVAYKEAKKNATRESLCNTEKAHIAKHNPCNNKYIGGNGRC